MSFSYLVPRSYEFHRENSETFITIGVMGSYFEYGRVSMFASKEFSFLLNFSGKAFAWVVKAQSFKVYKSPSTNHELEIAMSIVDVGQSSVTYLSQLRRKPSDSESRDSNRTPLVYAENKCRVVLLDKAKQASSPIPPEMKEAAMRYLNGTRLPGIIDSFTLKFDLPFVKLKNSFISRMKELVDTNPKEYPKSKLYQAIQIPVFLRFHDLDRLDHLNQTSYVKILENELYDMRHSLNQKRQFTHPFLKNVIGAHKLSEVRLLYQEQTHVGQDIFLHVFPMFTFDFQTAQPSEKQQSTQQQQQATFSSEAYKGLKDEELIAQFVGFGCDFINRQNGKSHTLGNFLFNFTPTISPAKL